VDLSDPTRAVTAILDGPVLAVLAGAGKPMTVGEVAALTPRGSEIGVRRSLARLVEQGIVRATEMGRNRVHELNREHVAAPVAEVLAGLRLVLWKRFRSTLGSWNPKPVYGCVFGSAARGDGDVHSDIDLLLVRAPVAGETDPRRGSGGLAGVVAGYASGVHGCPANRAAGLEMGPSGGAAARARPRMDRQSAASPGDVHVRVGRSPSAAYCAVHRDRP